MISLTVGTNQFPGTVAFIGGFVILFGLFSFFIKERLFLSDALVATIFGIIAGPLAIAVYNPYEWPGDLNTITLFFADLVMAVAIALPRAFWKKRLKPLSVLLGPVTIYMWLITTVIFWKVLNIDFLPSMILGACTAPTDPVLANSIMNGRFADIHIHSRLRQLLSAERYFGVLVCDDVSAVNDGTALPFFYLGLLLIKYPAGEALAKWGYGVWLYQIGLSVVFGLVLGTVTRIGLKYCEENKLIDKNSFLVFELALAFVSSGLAFTLGMSTFFATIVTGVTFSWDGWFARETEEAHVQEVLDMLVNIVFFLFFGAAIPWSTFNSETLPIWRLIVAAILVLLFRRLPIIILLSKWMGITLTKEETFFVGWFGPVGVGALWYMSFASLALPEYQSLFTPIIYFIVLSSVLVHGIMVPITHITLIGIRTRTMSKSSTAEVPMWPSGVPVTISMISGPVTKQNPQSSSSAAGDQSPATTNTDTQFTVRSYNDFRGKVTTTEHVVSRILPSTPEASGVLLRTFTN